MSREITGKTKVVGVTGDPVAHSRSPQMHNAAFAALGLDYVYVPFHILKGNFDVAVRGLCVLGVVGLNVTIPHKHDALRIADEASEEARLIGAANTLTFSDGKIRADNTDCKGFIRAMDSAGMPLTGFRHALLLGAGGSARSVCVALAREGMRNITISNRTVEKARAIAGDVSKHYDVQIKVIPSNRDVLADAVAECDLLINATSVGMKPDDPSLIDPEWLHEGIAVYDLVYTPPETRLVKAAQEKGLRCAGGIDMLVYQGALSFEIWTGHKPPIDVMKSALMRALGVSE